MAWNLKILCITRGEKYILLLGSFISVVLLFLQVKSTTVLLVITIKPFF